MKKLIYTMLCLCFCFTAEAQMGYYANHYMLNHQLINPAYAGTDLQIKGGLIANKSMAGIEASPTLLGGHISTPLGLSKASMGLNVASYSLGVQSNTELTGIYAYRVKLSKLTMVFGLQASYIQIAENNNDLKTGEADDDRFFRNTSGSGYNAGGGIYLYTKRSFISLSTPSWLRNRVNQDGSVSSDLNTRNMPLFISLGRESRLNKNWWLNSYVLVRHHMNSKTLADYNLLLSYKQNVWAGPYYKSGSQVGLMLGAKLNKHLKLSYAGAISQHRTPGFNGNTHEVSVLFNLKNKEVDSVTPLRFF